MVSMIIVDYKSMDKTIEYIKDCAWNIEGLDHFVIVDNASEVPFEPKRTSVEGKEVYIVSSGENDGYAKGNNLGAKTAKDIWNDDYYIFSNNDLKFQKLFFLDELLRPFNDDSNIAVVGPKVIGLSGDNQNPLPDLTWKQMLFGHFLSLLPPKGMVKSSPLQTTKGRTKAVVGAFLCVDSKAFWDVGGFDENTFLFVEEMILSKRFEKIGKYMYYNDTVEIIHEHGTTVKNTVGIIKSLKVDFDSRYYYAKEYCNAGKEWLILSKVNFHIVMALFRLKKSIKGNR
ncbi:Glycosyltransferase, GT2 family [Lachnospiraceae bacterium G11]|nr:Glycosyltransferase, GT2 family [Lachnospiraceae bacterium G11]